MLKHTIEPIFNKDSKVLILGSFPSPKSRETGFYYGHKHNRFWQVITKVFDFQELTSIEDKKQFLLDHKIAMFDVLKSCEIVGASDITIKNCKPNDLDVIYKTADIKMTFLTGKKAFELFNKFFDKPSICLPSTSPANCAKSLEELIEEYSIIRTFINK